MPTATIDDVWIYIYEQGDVRTRDLEQRFVKSKQMSRGTLYKYKRQLEHEGKIQSTPVHAKPAYNTYSVPSTFHQELNTLIQYKRLPFPPRSPLYNIEAIPWEDVPPGIFFVDAKRKVLWHDEETGALLVLFKGGPGIMEPLHYHPYANKWGYILHGEYELPDGTPLPCDNTYFFVPKGELHVMPKCRKESVALCYFDGPRTKVPVTNVKDEEFAKYLWQSGLHIAANKKE
jgi:hypothetical protein